MTTPTTRKPVGSVRTLSNKALPFPVTKKSLAVVYIATCRRKACGHKWQPRTANPLKCSVCQTERPYVEVMNLSKAI